MVVKLDTTIFKTVEKAYKIRINLGLHASHPLPNGGEFETQVQVPPSNMWEPPFIMIVSAVCARDLRKKSYTLPNGDLIVGTTARLAPEGRKTHYIMPRRGYHAVPPEKPYEGLFPVSFWLKMEDLRGHRAKVIVSEETMLAIYNRRDRGVS